MFYLRTCPRLRWAESARLRAANSATWSPRVRFGTYDVSRPSGKLRKAGVKIRVQRQSLKLLEKLLSVRERSLPGRNCEGASGLEEGKFW